MSKGRLRNAATRSSKPEQIRETSDFEMAAREMTRQSSVHYVDGWPTPSPPPTGTPSCGMTSTAPVSPPCR